MRIRVPALLLVPLLALALVGFTPTPASAGATMHPCACAATFPLAPPTLCYQAPGARVADFVYTAPADFFQVVGSGAGGYCRHNPGCQWLDAAGVAACAAFVGCACGTPTFGEEVCGNGIDDDCDGSVDTIAGQRFEDRGATVFDCQTNLEWEKKTADNVADFHTWSTLSGAPNGTAFTVFLPAVATALGGTACDHTTWSCEATTLAATDSPTCTSPPPAGCWRLPEIDELKTILTAQFPSCTSSPCIDPVFGPTEPSFYWSATSSSPLVAWSVFFDNGFVGGNDKVNAFHVRAVRSAP